MHNRNDDANIITLTKKDTNLFSCNLLIMYKKYFIHYISLKYTYIKLDINIY